MRGFGRLTAAAVAALSIAILQQRPRLALEAASGEVPRVPERLSQTGLFETGRVDRIDARNRPFSPQYPLWSDGARKSRWVYLPPNATIDTRAGCDQQPRINTEKLFREHPDRSLSSSCTDEKRRPVLHEHQFIACAAHLARVETRDETVTCTDSA